MSYYLLPNIINSIDENNIFLQQGKSNIIISKSLSAYLNSMKAQIDNYTTEWDTYKKYTNTYEYIHSIIPFSKFSVCKLKPLSRSFYKLIEIFNLLNLEFNNQKIKTFHLAEGPGGFIEAIINLRSVHEESNKLDKYYGMTLINDCDENVPGWKKSKYFLSKNPNVEIITGADKTGNLFSVENLWYCYNNFKNSMDLITGDGGFDFSIDFNKQEGLSLKLIFAQIVYAIALQKKDGIFILKIFDVFTNATIDLIYLLSSLYEKCYIVKPFTSRIANSEKYLVCKGFKLNCTTFNLVKKFATILSQINETIQINRFLNINISYLYINKIEDINAILGQQQLENILSTLNLLDNCKNDKLENIKKNNIQKCIQWCIKNKMPYNKNINCLNVFIAT